MKRDPYQRLWMKKRDLFQRLWMNKKRPIPEDVDEYKETNTRGCG
jgi:hypothetical protein